MNRLEELEARTPSRELDADEDWVSGELSSGPDQERGERADGDVLAGRTTYVRRLVTGPEGVSSSLADQVILCVHRRLEEPLTPGGVAKELFVSLRTLERGLAASLGCTPRQLILAMKMREAKNILAEGRLTVSETSYRLGFSSPAYFSRRFTAFFSRTPSSMSGNS